MNDVSLLPKKAPSKHSELTGHLKQYQDKLTAKYLEIIGALQKIAEDSAKATNSQLEIKMITFQSNKKELLEKQRTFLESMGKNSMNFDQLKKNLESISQDLIDKSIRLREETIEIYDNNFKKLQPVVTESFKKCEEFVSQLPANLPLRLETVVMHLNESYITTKTSLIQSLYNEEIDCRNIAEDAEEEFDQRSDDWRVNKFSVLVEEAKAKLDYKKMCDFNSIFNDFFVDQKKFTLCFRKVIQNISLIAPPDNFSDEDFDPWWKEAEDIMALHCNFVNTFIKKIEDKINEKKQENLALIENLEKELITLKNEAEAMQAMAEVVPLFKQCRKYNENFLNKVKRYWENRTNAIRAKFEAIKNFIQPLIKMYEECIHKTDESKNVVEESQKELKEKSNEKLVTFEEDLSSKINEIQMLVTEKEIKGQVEKCRQILLKIEGEYRSYYDQAVAIYDKQNPLILGIFDKAENDLLTLLKMKKTSKPPEWLSQSGRSNSKLISPQSVRRQKRPVSRAVKSRKKKGKDDDQVEIFHFELESGGGKFEESDPLNIFPSIEDFIDEATLPPQPVKGRGARGARGAQSRGARGARGGQSRGGSSRGGSNSNSSSGKLKPKAIDVEADDVEVPDFVLMEAVPKINEEYISILIYTPENNEIEGWKNMFRKALISSFQELYANEVAFSNYEQERLGLADELNERMRTHASRANSIELNVAQTRLVRLDTRRVQLEKHFRKATLVFNKGLKSLENNIEKRSINIKAEAKALHSFVEELEKQKNSTTFQQLNQEFTIKQKNFSVKFQQKIEIDHKEIEEFITSFKTSNERFVNSLGGADVVFSDEERDMCMKFFERMEVQVNHIVESLNGKENEMKNEIDAEVKSIADEFTVLFPHHRNDMVFIDAMNTVQLEAKSKLDSLLFRNKQSEADLERTIQKVRQTRDQTDDPQLAIEKEFEALENMRMTLIRRAKFLNILNSKITLEPIQFNVVLGNELNENEKLLSDSGGAVSGRRSAGRTRTSAVKTRPDSGKRVTSTSRRSTESINEVLQTLQGQIDSIGNEMILKLNPTINEYYSQLKARKFQVTRPEQIPNLAPECVERNKKRWKQTDSIVPSIYEECCRVFRSQVSQAIEVARDSIPYVFGLYEKFYIIQQNEKREKIQEEFEEEYQQLAKDRLAHRKALTPRITDENNVSQMKSLMDEEASRRTTETDLVNTLNEQIWSNEVKTMQLFIGHLPLITKVFLQTFDSFVLPEDLIGGNTNNNNITSLNNSNNNNNNENNNVSVENENTETRRMTLKEMLKEKERRTVNPINDPNRPFPQKMWPTLNAIMNPLLSYITKPQDSASNAPLTPTSSRKAPRGRKTTNKKSEEKKNAEAQQIDKIPVQTSLETPIHRAVIYQRNCCYNDYEQQLAERIEKVKLYINSLKQEGTDFDDHWKKCIISMKPDFIFKANSSTNQNNNNNSNNSASHNTSNNKK